MKQQLTGSPRNSFWSKAEWSPDASFSLPEVFALINQQKVAAIAQKLLSGNISVIEAARQISACRDESVGLDQTNSDFVTFLAIDRATDHQLIGEDLQNGARPYALARKDAVVARCEEAHRSDAFDAAARLVTQFAEELVA